MIRRWIIMAARIAALFLLGAVAGAPCAAQETTGLEEPQPFKLVRAVMCESITGYEPASVAVVFSISTGKISCFTGFENIPSTTHTIHRWYRRDELVTTYRLTLKPPRWSTYSSIQLREADKGPWRVEILDEKDQLMRTLRFSVTD